MHSSSVITTRNWTKQQCPTKASGALMVGAMDGPKRAFGCCVTRVSRLDEAGLTGRMARLETENDAASQFNTTDFSPFDLFNEPSLNRVNLLQRVRKARTQRDYNKSVISWT